VYRCLAIITKFINIILSVMKAKVVVSVEETREAAGGSRSTIPASWQDAQAVLRPEDELPLIPPVGQWVNASDLLNARKMSEIKRATKGWTDIRAVVKSVDFRKKSKEFRVEILVMCIKQINVDNGSP